MVNIATPNPPALVGGVEAVAFGQPVFNCARLAGKRWAAGGIACAKHSGWCAAMRAAAGVCDLFTNLYVDCGIEIRQVKTEAGKFYGNGIACIKAEKPHTGLTINRYIRAQV